MCQLHYKKILAGLVGLVVLIGVFSLGQIKVTNAASLYIVPASTKVSVGNIVSARVLVGTGGKSINNAEATLQYPSDLLEVLSISKSSSIFSLWVEEPKFFNYEGKITFNGGVPNPGYIGESGEIMSVTFRSKKTGTASVVFGDAAVRENNGLGTDILETKSASIIEITSSQPVEVAPPPLATGAPSAPVVISSTHPEQNKWYNKSDVELRWEVPEGVTAVSTLVGKNPTSIPTVIYSPPIGNKKVTDLEDGVWYFHIRFKNKDGWGAMTHFKIQIDTVAPNPFKIAFPHGSTSEDPRPIAYFNTTDDLSGIDHYEVKIGDGQYMRISTEQVSSNPYSPPEQDPGSHPIIVKAIDLASNETVQTAEFTISSINVPKIEEYNQELASGELLRIRGTSYPSITIEMVIEDSTGKKSNQMVNTLANGEFEALWPKILEKGQYKLYLRAIDNRGAKSNFTEAVNFCVKESTLKSVGALVLNWLSVVFIVALAIGGITLLVMYFCYRNRIMKKVIARKVRTAESSIHKAFDLLRENVREQIKTLENAKGKRALTKEEEKVIKHLQENLTKSEQYLEKDMLDIENTLSKK